MTSCMGSWVTRAYKGVINHVKPNKANTPVLAVPLNRINLFQKLVYPIRWLLSGERIVSDTNIVQEFDYFIYYSISTGQILGSIWTGGQRLNMDELKRYKIMKTALHASEFLPTYGKVDRVIIAEEREKILFRTLDVYSLFMRTLMVNEWYQGHAAWYITYIAQRWRRIHYRLFFMLVKIIDYNPNSLCEKDTREFSSLILSAGSLARLRAGKVRVLLIRPILDETSSTYGYDYRFAYLDVCIPEVITELYPDYRDRVIPVLAVQPIVHEGKKHSFLIPSLIPFHDVNDNELIILFILSAVFLLSPYLEKNDGFIRVGEVKKRAKKIMKRLGISYDNTVLFGAIEELISGGVLEVRSAEGGRVGSQAYIRVRDPYEIMFNVQNYGLRTVSIKQKYNIPLSIRDLRCLLYTGGEDRLTYLVI